MEESSPQSDVSWQPLVAGIVAVILVLVLLAVCGVFGGCVSLIALFLLLSYCTT
jgi:hypothetical protein